MTSAQIIGQLKAAIHRDKLLAEYYSGIVIHDYDIRTDKFRFRLNGRPELKEEEISYTLSLTSQEIFRRVTVEDLIREIVKDLKRLKANEKVTT